MKINEDKSNFKFIQDSLKDLAIPFIVNEKLVRGLDYYNGMIFEITSSSIGAQSALCGGGRYDKLIQQLGGKQIPAVGFAAGLERLMIILKDKTDYLDKGIDIYIISCQSKFISQSIIIADTLRNQLGIKVTNETLRRSMRSQMREANKLNAQFVIIIGQENTPVDEVIIKNMNDGSQINASIDKIEDYFGVDYEYK